MAFRQDNKAQHTTLNQSGNTHTRYFDEKGRELMHGTQTTLEQNTKNTNPTVNGTAKSHPNPLPAAAPISPALSLVAAATHQPKDKKTDAKSTALVPMTPRIQAQSDSLTFLLAMLNMPLPMLVLEYAYLYDSVFYNLVVCPETKVSGFGFFNRDEKHGDTYTQTENIARDLILTAGPLEDIQDLVRINPRVLLPRIRLPYHLEGMPEPLMLEGTLEQLAIILLDLRLISNSGVIDEGIADLLRALRTELLPDTLPLAAEQAQQAAPMIDEKAIDNMQLPVLNQVFDNIKRNKPNDAVTLVRAYIKSIKPEVITDYRYFLKLLRLLGNAFRVLADRGRELNGKWYGPQGDQYCYKVIGLAIEAAFGKRMRKILENGPFNFFYNIRVPARTVDRNSNKFLQDGSLILGENSFYGYWGRVGRRGGRGAGCRGGLESFFQTYAAITSAGENFYVVSPPQRQAKL